MLLFRGTPFFVMKDPASISHRPTTPTWKKRRPQIMGDAVNEAVKLFVGFLQFVIDLRSADLCNCSSWKRPISKFCTIWRSLSFFS